jgi:F420-dependent hydroxymycolic acid dehydrogenase
MPDDPRAISRRNLLASAGALMGVTMLAANSQRSFSQPTMLDQESDLATGPQSTSLVSKNVGFMLAHEQFPVSELVKLAEAAEEAGFDLLATSDHLQPWQSNEGHAGEAWVTLAAVGQRTRRVWMGTTVTCPTFRYNPAVVAEAFTSLDLLSPGRVFLGVGSGEALNEQAATGSWPKWPERSERLIEATEIIRQLWTGKQIDHKGTYYHVNARLYDAPSTRIPLLMAANGPKAMRRAGQHGDGLITDPKTWKQYKDEFVNAAKSAGKDPTQMPVLVEQYVVVGDQNLAEAAADLWRFGPKAFKTYYNVRDPEEIQRRAKSEITLPQVYSEWPVSTDPSVHLKKVNELFDSGVTIVNIHSGQADQKKVIEFYGKEILPKLNRQGGQKAA